MIGGAIGYVGYDCVKYFEPKTRRDMKDVLKLPESLFMLYDTIVCLDHFSQQCKVFTYLKVPQQKKEGWLESEYERCKNELREMAEVLNSEDVPLPEQGPIKLDQYVPTLCTYRPAVLIASKANDLQHRTSRLRAPRHASKGAHLQRRHHPSSPITKDIAAHVTAPIQCLQTTTHSQSITLPFLC